MARRVDNPPNPKFPPGGITGAVRLENVTFTYPGADRPVLQDISLTASPGTTTAIVGSTGSGKSTLVSLICRLYDVSGGAVTVDDIDVRGYHTEQLWAAIGLIPQRGYLFSGTVAENLRYGAAPGQVVIGPPADMDGDGLADPNRPIGGPIPMNPTVRNEDDVLTPGMAPVDLGVVEEDAPTAAELADLNARLQAQGIAPMFPPFQWCIRFVRARHIWGIDRRFVMDCWRHHWSWFVAQHITLATGTHRIWLTRTALSAFNYSGHHFVVGLPPRWHMLTLIHVRFFRVCYRVYCPYPGVVRIKLEQVYVVLPNDPNDPNSDLMLLTTESNENALNTDVPPAVRAGLQPDPLPVGTALNRTPFRYNLA